MDISNIACSLSFGNLLDRKQSILIWFCVFFCFAVEIILFICLFLSAQFNKIEFYSILGANLIFISLLAIATYIIIKDFKNKKKTLTYIEDAVMLTAYCKKVSEIYLGFQPSAIKIEVSFVFNKLTFIKASTAKVFGGKKGFLGTFKKYADRHVKILYSPKHGEVFILKD